MRRYLLEVYVRYWPWVVIPLCLTAAVILALAWHFG